MRATSNLPPAYGGLALFSSEEAGGGAAPSLFNACTGGAMRGAPRFIVGVVFASSVACHAICASCTSGYDCRTCEIGTRNSGSVGNPRIDEL